MQSVPTFDEYMNPILKALHELGGSATNQEIFEKVSEESGQPPDKASSLPQAHFPVAPRRKRRGTARLPLT